jgi:hypothetical protein
VAECFQPYLDSINIGGNHAPGNTTDRPPSSVLFQAGDERSAHEEQIKRDILLKKWKGTMQLIAGGTSNENTRKQATIGESDQRNPFAGGVRTRAAPRRAAYSEPPGRAFLRSRYTGPGSGRRSRARMLQLPTCDKIALPGPQPRFSIRQLITPGQRETAWMWC